MNSDLNSIPQGRLPQPSAFPAPKAAPAGLGAGTFSSHPSKTSADSLPAGFGFPSAPGLGGKLDLYDTSRKADMGFPASELPSAGPDFPYLKPLTGMNLGKSLDTLV